MRRAAWAVSVIALLLMPGCANHVFGMCGPTLMSVETSAVMDVALDAHNKTVAQRALHGLGFVGNDTSGHALYMNRDADWVRLYDYDPGYSHPSGGNSSQFVYEMGGVRREFNSQDEARSAGQSYAPEVLSRFNATFGAFHAVTNWSLIDKPVVQPSIVVC